MPDHDTTDESRHSTFGRVTDGPMLAFHRQLVDAIEAEHRQPDDAANVTELRPRRPATTGARRLTTVAAAAAVVTVGIGATSLWVGNDTPDVSADVTVQRNGDRVTVVLEDDISVDQVAAKLAAAGVDVSVQGLPTGPSRVDRFVGVIGPESAKLEGGDGRTSNRATFIAGSRVILQVGVPGDGFYDAATDAFDRGEALEGTSLVGVPARAARDELVRRAAASGATLEYRRSLGTVMASPDDVADTDVILSAQGVAKGKVIVMIGPVSDLPPTTTTPGSR